jgi:hypothetical protein
VIYYRFNTGPVGKGNIFYLNLIIGPGCGFW